MRNEKTRGRKRSLYWRSGLRNHRTEVFEINEAGLAYVGDPEGADEETIQRVKNLCPSQAISWFKDKE